MSLARHDKVGKNGKTKHDAEHGDLTSHVLIKFGKKLRLQKYSRKLKCNCIMFDPRSEVYR
ncbi:hypothetical protein [uncultured Bacteroides sp.]|uniref:hypothetical protein n=1 Tax=uncultured Bacteroides sp. TaxID=162156 RepID=UPI0025A98CAA|nr:hypothetical protein [uncultured Bacteroides sp.]